jgi:hypothetical protein
LKFVGIPIEEKVMTYPEKGVEGIPEKFQHNNIYNNTYNNKKKSISKDILKEKEKNFLEFYSKYPRKISKLNAEKSYDRTIDKELATHKEIMK